MKKRYVWPLKGHNPYKESSDNFDPMETFVELLMLKRKVATDFLYLLYFLIYKPTSVVCPPGLFLATAAMFLTNQKTKHKLCEGHPKEQSYQVILNSIQ